MNLRPHSLIIDDEYRPVRCTMCNGEPFTKPDYKGKKHSRPYAAKPRQRWVRHPRAQWVEA